MQAMFKEIENYRQNIGQVREQLHDNYFSIKELLKNADKSQLEIEKMIQTLESDRRQKQLRHNIVTNKLTPHPHRKPLLANILTQADDDRPNQVTNQLQNAIQQLITQNCTLQLAVKPIRFHPTYLTNVNAQTGHHLIPECKLKLWVYHIDKMVDSTYFAFCPHHSRNIHKTAATNIKFETLHIIHRITTSNFILMQELLQQKVYLFLENEFKLITAMCTLTMAELLEEKKSPKMLKFVVIGTTKEVFVLEAFINLRKVVTSPDLADLLEKMHVKRVVVNENNRSRSPSPTLHRQTANSVLKSTKTKRVAIMNNRTINISLGVLASNEQERKIAITSTSNIASPSLELNMQKGELVVKMLVRLLNDEEEGYLEYKVGENVMKVTVKDIKLLTFISLQKSRAFFKSDADCEKVNALVALTDNIYIRPNMTLRIQQTPLEQKVVKNSIVAYFCKTEHNPEQFLVYPLSMIEGRKVDKGVSILYSLNSEWVEDRKQFKVVIAAKSKARYIKVTNVLETVMKSSLGMESKQKQQYFEYYIQLYVIKHQILPLPEPEVSLSLEVDELGIYGLDMTGILMKNSRYLVQSMNDNLLHVINQEFVVQEGVFREDQSMHVQVLQNIDIKESVILLLHDLTRSVMTTVRVQVNQKEYWKKKQ